MKARTAMLMGFKFEDMDDVRMFEKWIFSTPTPTTVEFTKAMAKFEITLMPLNKLEKALMGDGRSR